MEGDWLGQGDQTYLISGRRQALTIQVHSFVEGDHLVSQSHVEVTPEGGIPSSSDRTIWFKADVERPGRYFVGTGLEPDPAVTAEADFDGATLSFEQKIGGTPPYFTRSATVFTDAQSVYTETGWHGQVQLSKASINYVRVQK